MKTAILNLPARAWVAARKAFTGLLVAALITVGSSQPAHAVIFNDGPAFAQRIAQLAIVLGQWAQMIKTARDQYMMVQAAAQGLKDWKNFGWVAAFDLVQLPWFDDLSGIDDIRAVVDATSMAGQELGSLFNQIETTQRMLNDPRYQKDEWYRMKVKMLNTSSTRARKVKLAMVKKMRKDIEDVQLYIKQIKELQGQIQTLSTSNDPDTKKIAALQARIQQLQAQVNASGIIGTNQKILTAMTGEATSMAYWEKEFAGAMYSKNSAQIKRLANAITKAKKK